MDVPRDCARGSGLGFFQHGQGVRAGTDGWWGLWLAFPSFVRDDHGLDSCYGPVHISSKQLRTELKSANLGVSSEIRCDTGRTDS